MLCSSGHRPKPIVCRGRDSATCGNPPFAIAYLRRDGGHVLPNNQVCIEVTNQNTSQTRYFDVVCVRSLSELVRGRTTASESSQICSKSYAEDCPEPAQASRTRATVAASGGSPPPLLRYIHFFVVLSKPVKPFSRGAKFFDFCTTAITAQGRSHRTTTPPANGHYLRI